MRINGQAVSGNPVYHYQVPPGRVKVQFQVTDSAGVWSVDTTFTLVPGDTNLGRIQLRRPPTHP